MTYRVNGIGTTIAPMPSYGEHSISMHWFTIFFIPVIPLGWVLVSGTDVHNQYRIIKKMSYSEVHKNMGMKGMILTVGYGFFINILTLIIVCSVLLIVRFAIHVIIR